MKRSFLRAVPVFAVAAVAAVSATSARADDVQSYTTVEGDSCEGLAAKFWGDPKVYAKLHELNPQMGPVPHKIKPGTVLKVAKPGPDARVTFIRNHVEAATPAVHPAANGEPLMKGNKVDTFEKSNAEVTFKDDSRLQLAEQTLVIILGSTFSKATFGKTAEDTTLVKGNLAAFLSGSATKKVATPSGSITLGGDAKIGVDAKDATRLAVYKGKSTLSNAGKSVDVKEGFGSKAEKGKAPTPPRPLPIAPTWVKSIAPLTLTTAGEVDLSGTFAPGVGGPKVVSWHVQLSRDASFNDLVLDAQHAGTATTFDAQKLAAGRYFARVSGIDDDFFEGPWGAVSTFDVATTTIVPAAAGKGASLQITPGIFCGLDGAPLVATASSASTGNVGLALAPLRAHKLECALDAAGTGASEVSISAEQSGLATATTVLGEASFDGEAGHRDVRITLLDPSGAPIVGAQVEMKSTEFTVDPVKAEPAGVYLATLRWKSASPASKVRFVVEGVQTIDVEVPAAGPDSAPPPKAEPTTLKPFRLEVGIVGLAQLPSDPLGGGGGIGLDLGGRFLVGKGAVTVGLRPMYERHLAGSSHDIACSSDAPGDSGCRFGAANYRSAIESDLFSLGIPITYRLKNEASSWTPYLGVVPQLLFDRTKEVVDAGLGPSGQLIGGQNDASYATRFALATMLGVQVSTSRGGRGSFFLELGWRFAAHREVSGTNAEPKGPLAWLGYRLAL